MSFDSPNQAPGRTYARDVRAAFDMASAGPKKDAARAHLLAAERAELGRDEAWWILEIDRAARALS